MAENEAVKPAPRSLGERLTSVPKFTLYFILMIVSTIALFPTVVIPNKPSESSIDLYVSLMTLPQGSTIILQSDWTNSSRGESAGAMEALLRLVMRKELKLVFMSVGDPSAPQVARDTLRRINLEREKNGERPYKKWDDYIELGYFPNAEGTANTMADNLRNAWKGKRDAGPSGQMDVWQSPVLQGINRIEDIKMIVNIHASDTLARLIERIGRKTKLASMCTGVMGPETLVYYRSGQVAGVSVGLNGVVQFETLMARGIDPDISEKDSQDTKKPVRAPGRPAIPGFEGKTNYARGMQYYLSLHVALTLLIVAVALGNIGTFLVRRRSE